MSARIGAANLANACKDLKLEWQQTRNYWRDQKAVEFEEHYLERLEPLASAALRAMEEIDVLCRKVRSDCE